MSAATRQAASRALRSSRRSSIRSFQTSSAALADPPSPSSSTSPSAPSSSSTDTDRPPTRWFLTPKKFLPPTPIRVSQPPQFPAPNDPFNQPSVTPTAKDGTALPPVPATSANGTGRHEYSDTTKAVVRGVARLMGYNSKASTAIRETGRMMRGMVEAIERDRVYWYEECGLPPTYQTFFQLHLLYVLILLPRLRAIATTASSTQHAIPEPLDPTPPHHPTPDIATATTSSVPTSTSTSTSITAPPSSSSTPILGKPDHESYPSELLNHFFELAESEMRKVLGRGERERVVKKYMDEMGEQWKGAGAGLDYVMGLGTSEVAEERGKADLELASWVWRNLFASQGLTAGPELPTGTEIDEGGIASREVELLGRVEEVVLFVRREMARLDEIQDEDVLEASIGQWGSPRSVE